MRGADFTTRLLEADVVLNTDILKGFGPQM